MGRDFSITGDASARPTKVVVLDGGDASQKGAYSNYVMHHGCTTITMFDASI